MPLRRSLPRQHISDHAAAAWTGVFFNPTGEAVVLLAEATGRALTLRDLEAQHLGLVLRKESLAEHLGKEAETVAYTGACRAITNRIPQSRAAILSGLAALGLSAAVDADAAVISIWTLKPDGNVAKEAIVPGQIIRFEQVRGRPPLTTDFCSASMKCVRPGYRLKLAGSSSASSIFPQSAFT